MTKLRHDPSLLTASRKGDVQLVKQLIRKGVDVNAQNREGQTALIEAVRGNTRHRDDIVKILLSRGANITPRDSSGLTALSWAAIHGHCKTLQLLVLSQHFKLNT